MILLVWSFKKKCFPIYLRYAFLQSMQSQSLKKKKTKGCRPMRIMYERKILKTKEKGEKKIKTWAILMMNWRNVGCKPASFLSLLAMGLEIVLRASVPSLKRGSTIVLFLVIIDEFRLFKHSVGERLILCAEEVGVSCRRRKKPKIQQQIGYKILCSALPTHSLILFFLRNLSLSNSGVELRPILFYFLCPILPFFFSFLFTPFVSC